MLIKGGLYKILQKTRKAQSLGVDLAIVYDQNGSHFLMTAAAIENTKDIKWHQP